jgi:hypothetical protein
MNNTVNQDKLPWQEPSEEILGKLDKADANKIREDYKKAKSARDNALQKLKEDKEKNKNITDQEFQERQKQIEDGIKLLYEKKIAVPIIENGKNGTIVSKHKNKLGFIFIGDVKKAEESDKEINAPKISMVIGGGLESAFNPNSGQQNSIDPRDDQIIGASAELHLVSLSDIDVKGILNINTLSNRSAIKAKADVIDFSAREMVIIRSLGEAYTGSGARVLAPGGVHIISGHNYKKSSGEETLIKEPEPMVLGKKLSDTIIEIVDKLSEINSTILSMNEDMLALKIALLAHFHVSAVGPVSPSADLAASVAPTIASKTVLNISNGYSSLINLELLKTNKLTALSPEKFLSDYNRVN